jgi:hypothetical protein
VERLQHAGRIAVDRLNAMAEYRDKHETREVERETGIEPATCSLDGQDGFA